MRRPLAPPVVLLVVALVGCRALPLVPSGECGNRVVEAPEDCDVYSNHGAECRPPGSPGECHFDCSPVAGNRAPCPSGFGCDPSYVCRRATGTFEQVGAPLPGDAETLVSGDFDGDGRQDIVGLEQTGAYGATRVSVHYFDAQGLLADEWRSTQLLVSPAVANVSPGDVRSDLLLAGNAIAVLLGEADRTLSPDVRPTYYVRGADVRIASVLGGSIDGSSAIVVLMEKDGKLALLRPGTADEFLTKLSDVPGTIATLAGKPAVGRLFEDAARPCSDLLLAQRGAREVRSYQTCRLDTTTSQVHFRDDALVTKRAFEPAASVAGPPLFADLDGDGHLDVLAPSDRGLYAAFGDGQELGPLEPFDLTLTSTAPTEVERERERQLAELPPLVAGDFTGDGLADFVNPNTLIVSERQPGGEVTYHLAESAIGAPWSEACLGDFTGDGRPDVLAASSERPDLDWFAGTGTDRPNPFVSRTTRPARHLAVGDFDGDLIDDIAFVEHDGPSDDDTVRVAFGGSEASMDLSVNAGHLVNALDLTAASDNPNDLVSGLIVTNANTDPDGGMGSALSLLEGTGQRRLLSYIELTTFSSNESIDQAKSLGVTTGHVFARDQLDAVVLGQSNLASDVNPLFSMWVLPDLASHGSTTLRLGWAFDEHLAPAVERYEPLVSIHVGDLDGDGLDELLLAAPIEDGSRCMLGIARVDVDAKLLTAGGTITLDTPCRPRPALSVVDVDDDGASDLVLLTGGVDSGGSVLVLFNEGAGTFDASAALELPASENTRAFALFRPTPTSALRLATVSATEVFLFESRGSARAFSQLGSVASVHDGTGIAAADVNGDGVTDLVVADGGDIQVLKAGVARP